MSAMQAKLQEAKTWWTGLAPRERALVAAMAAVIGVAALWSLSDWTQGERKRLARALPQAKARLNAMRDDAAEVQTLQRTPARAAVPPASLADPLQASARARGLTMDVRVDGNGLHAKGGGSFDLIVEWLADAQKDNGLGVVRLSTSRGPNGVAIEADLQASGAQ